MHCEYATLLPFLLILLAYFYEESIIYPQCVQYVHLERDLVFGFW